MFCRVRTHMYILTHVVIEGRLASDDGETLEDDALLPHLQLRQSHHRADHISLRQVPLQTARRRRSQNEAQRDRSG